HETVLEEMQVRLANAPQVMTLRKQTVEHPFGTLKQWMGATHFLTRRLGGRVMKIIGMPDLMRALAP
ncbi:hypothetical protein A221_07701, partial [Pseudomonas syringae pv. actinidiae ICMP 18801]